MSKTIKRLVQREMLRAKIHAICLRFHLIYGRHEIPHYALKDFLRNG